MEQKLYEIIDAEIKRFVVNNYEELMKIEGTSIISIDHLKAYSRIREWPFLIRFIGRHRGAEGVVFSFIDDNMDKVYSYYDEN